MEKNNLKISIVMPSFNCVNYIERAIKSVLSQDYANFDLFIKDGGSEDGTLEVIKYYAKKYPNKIQWISKKDRGQADAINYAIGQVNGDIIGWLNSDDVYKSGALNTVAQYFGANSGVKWVYGKCDIIDSNDKEIRSWITSYKNFWLKHYNYQVLLTINFISQMGVFWRKDIVRKTELLNPKYYYVMDYDNWLRFGKFQKPGYIDKYLASFRIIHSSKSSNGFISQFQEELDVAKKYTNNKISIILHLLHIKVITLVYLILRLINQIKSKFKYA